MFSRFSILVLLVLAFYAQQGNGSNSCDQISKESNSHWLVKAVDPVISTDQNGGKVTTFCFKLESVIVGDTKLYGLSHFVIPVCNSVNEKFISATPSTGFSIGEKDPSSGYEPSDADNYVVYKWNTESVQSGDQFCASFAGLFGQGAGLTYVTKAGTECLWETVKVPACDGLAEPDCVECSTDADCSQSFGFLSAAGTETCKDKKCELVTSGSCAELVPLFKPGHVTCDVLNGETVLTCIGDDVVTPPSDCECVRYSVGCGCENIVASDPGKCVAIAFDPAKPEYDCTLGAGEVFNVPC